MALVIGAAIVWLALFAALQLALRYHAEPTAEHATVFAKPIDSLRNIDDVKTELLEFSDSRSSLIHV